MNLVNSLKRATPALSGAPVTTGSGDRYTAGALGF